MNSQRLGACTLLVIYINFAPVARPYLPHGRLPLFSLYLFLLALSLFILVWQMNLGQKLWKLKWVPPVEGDHCTNLNFRAMMKPKKEREKKSNQEVATKHFARLRCLWPKLKPQKVSGDGEGGGKEKGLPAIRNAHIQLVIWIAVLFPFPHRRAAYATRSTNNSLLPTSNSFNWTCCLPRSLPLFFCSSFLSLFSELIFRPDQTTTKGTLKTLHKIYAVFW